jgi:hypothetical protein
MLNFLFLLTAFSLLSLSGFQCLQFVMPHHDTEHNIQQNDVQHIYTQYINILDYDTQNKSIKDSTLYNKNVRLKVLFGEVAVGRRGNWSKGISSTI